MAKQVFINLPVEDLVKSTAFYEALGFMKNPMFSDDNASAMAWSDEIIVMLLQKDFYQQFLRDKSIADTRATSGVLLALSVNSKEAVQTFADTAKANGGDYFTAGPQMPEDMMVGVEVLDPDGHQWEAVWMNPNFDPQAEVQTV